MPPLIELQDIVFSYSTDNTQQNILDGVNITLFEQQRMGLLGPNGCGKTSIFHVIMGLLPPQKGKILFKGEEVKKERDFRRLREDIGLLFQDADDQLFSPTVLEDVAFGPLNLGVKPDEARDRAVETLEKLGLASLEQRITHQLSGGEKKLVSLATILSMQPEVLLLDEPTNNLDPATRQRLIEILGGLDLASIIISHDWDFLAETCRDIYAMDQGKIAQCEQPLLHNHHHAHPYGTMAHQHGE